MWKTLTRYTRAGGITDAPDRPLPDDVDMILAAVDAYVHEIRRSKSAGPRHYAPMRGGQEGLRKTVCGVPIGAGKQLRLTGSPADADCHSCRATQQWRKDAAA